jgi:hypothetical protein
VELKVGKFDFFFKVEKQIFGILLPPNTIFRQTKKDFVSLPKIPLIEAGNRALVDSIWFFRLWAKG